MILKIKDALKIKTRISIWLFFIMFAVLSMMVCLTPFFGTLPISTYVALYVTSLFSTYAILVVLEWMANI